MDRREACMMIGGYLMAPLFPGGPLTAIELKATPIARFPHYAIRDAESLRELWFQRHARNTLRRVRFRMLGEEEDTARLFRSCAYFPTKVHIVESEFDPPCTCGNLSWHHYECEHGELVRPGVLFFKVEAYGLGKVHLQVLETISPTGKVIKTNQISIRAGLQDELRLSWALIAHDGPDNDLRDWNLDLWTPKDWMKRSPETLEMIHRIDRERGYPVVKRA